MSKFCIKTVDGANIERITTLFERSRSGFVRSWTVASTYESGYVYCDGNSLPSESETVVCDTMLGCKMGLLVDVEFTFDDTFSDRDRQTIINSWDPDFYENKWLVEEDYVRVNGPVAVDVVSEDVLR